MVLSSASNRNRFIPPTRARRTTMATPMDAEAALVTQRALSTDSPAGANNLNMIRQLSILTSLLIVGCASPGITRLGRSPVPETAVASTNKGDCAGQGFIWVSR